MSDIYDGGLAYFPGSLRFWPSMCLTQGHIHVMSLVEQPKVSTCLEMRVWSREACQEFLSNWMWTKKGTLLTSPIITLSGLKIHRFIDFGDVQTWETGYVNPFNRGACFLWHDVWYGNASQAFFFSLGYMAKLSWRFPFFHPKNPHWQCCSPIIPYNYHGIKSWGEYGIIKNNVKLYQGMVNLWYSWNTDTIDMLLVVVIFHLR